MGLLMLMRDRLPLHADPRAVIWNRANVIKCKHTGASGILFVLRNHGSVEVADALNWEV